MRLWSAVLLALAIVLAGCTSQHAPSPSPTSNNAAQIASVGPFPTSSGSFGDKPVLSFDSTAKPSPKLQRKVLRQGSGPVIAKGDLLVLDYLGQIWRGKVFDDSYDRHAAAAVQIGIGDALAAWDT